MFNINENIIRKIVIQILAEVQRKPGPFGPPGPPRPPGTAGVTNGIGDGTERFIFQDVKNFDPFYDGKSINTGFTMEHAGENTYFRDVHVFINKIIDVSRTKNDVVRQNLQLCFRSSVLKWYIF